jgi:hypothetical protein
MAYLLNKPKDLAIKLKADLGATRRAISRKFSQVKPEIVRTQVLKGIKFIATELNSKKCSIIMSFRPLDRVSYCSDILDISVKTLNRIKLSHEETQLEIEKRYFKYVAEHSVALLILKLKIPSCDEDFTIEDFFNFYYHIKPVHPNTTENQLKLGEYQYTFYYYLFNVARQIKNEIYSFILNQLLSKLQEGDVNKSALEKIITTNDFNFDFLDPELRNVNPEAFAVLHAIANNKANTDASNYAGSLLNVNYNEASHPFNIEVDIDKIVVLMESGYNRYRSGVTPPQTNGKKRRTFKPTPPIAQPRGTPKKTSATATTQNTLPNELTKLKLQIDYLTKQLEDCNKKPQRASSAAPNAVAVSNMSAQAIPAIVASAETSTPKKPEDYVDTFKKNLLEFMTTQIEEGGVPNTIDNLTTKMEQEYVKCLTALKYGRICENNELKLTIRPLTIRSTDPEYNWSEDFWGKNINHICNRKSNLRFGDFKPLFRFNSDIEVTDNELRKISSVLALDITSNVSLYDRAFGVAPELIETRLYVGSKVMVDGKSANITEFTTDGSVKVELDNGTTSTNKETELTITPINETDFKANRLINNKLLLAAISEMKQSQRSKLTDYIRKLSKVVVSKPSVQSALLSIQPTSGGKRRTLKKNKKYSRMNKKRSMRR